MKEKKPYVSIIVPVYNVEIFLRECLNSIVNQTLENIEIICVDDGSTDNSLKILKEYASKDGRIKIISKENSGYGNTMNVGLDNATGDYIGIVESDDYVEKNMFQRLYETACKYKVEIVKSDHYIFATKEGKQKKKFQAVCPIEYYNRILNAQESPEIFDFTMMNWTGIYKREFVEENKIRHNETPGASFQDNGFWFQTMALARSIVFINEAFYCYRQDNPNSSINSKEKVFCICDEYSYIQNFLDLKSDLAKKFYPYFFKKKVFNYLNSYHRIADQFKVQFLERAAKEFRKDLKSTYFDKEQIDSWIFSQVNRIIDSPELFYIEDTEYLLIKEYQKIHEQLMLVRNSREFQMGLKIKKMLQMEDK